MYNNAFLTEANQVELGYDLNGNMVAGPVADMEYNWDNKVRSATVGGDSLSFRYDPDGNRIASQSVESGVSKSRKYIVAVIATLPVILMELDPNNANAVVNSYVYANDQVVMQHAGDMDAPKYFYLRDHLGSVRQVVDSDGEVVNLYNYTPHGEAVAPETQETIYNPFQFTGQWYDTKLLQYNLRARPYYPAIGRFGSHDPVRGTFRSPLTLHPYLYCLNDPVNHTDPTGMVTKEEVTYSTGAAAGLGGAGSSQGMAILQNVRTLADMLGTRAQVYSKTIVDAASGNINAWTRTMNQVGLEVHHVVGRGWGNVQRLGQGVTNSVQNLIALDPDLHGPITQFMNSGYRVHAWMAGTEMAGFRTLQHYVSTLNPAQQFNWGMAALTHLATYGSMSGFSPVMYGL